MRAAETLRHLIGPLELLHEKAGPGLLRLARLGIFALWIFELLFDPIWQLADVPHELFDPAGMLSRWPLAWQDALLTPTGLISLWVATILACVLCCTNRAFPLTATLAAILLTIYSSLVRSFGPAVHTDIVLLLAVYALAGFAWADCFTRKPWKNSAYPLITIVILLCTAYSLVGINRAVSGGIGVFTGDTMEAWTVDAGMRGYYFNTDIGWRIPEWPLVVFVLRCGLPVVTMFEITAPLCLAWPHYRRVFIPVMLSFHLLSLVLMNIFFYDHMLLYLLLIDWSRHFKAMRRPDEPASP